MSRLRAPALLAVSVSISLLAAFAAAGSSGATTPPSTPASTETIGTDASGSASVSSPPEEGPLGIVDEEVLIDVRERVDRFAFHGHYGRCRGRGCFVCHACAEIGPA